MAPRTCTGSAIHGIGPGIGPEAIASLQRASATRPEYPQAYIAQGIALDGQDWPEHG
jgi:hypothetical protein